MGYINIAWWNFATTDRLGIQDSEKRTAEIIFIYRCAHRIIKHVSEGQTVSARRISEHNAAHKASKDVFSYSLSLLEVEIM
jgi:hypothetical protein